MVSCKGIRNFTVNKKKHLHVALQMSRNNLDENFMANGYDEGEVLSTPRRIWFNPSRLSLAEFSAESNVSYKASNSGTIDGRILRVVGRNCVTVAAW